LHPNKLSIIKDVNEEINNLVSYRAIVGLLIPMAKNWYYSMLRNLVFWVLQMATADRVLFPI
jgi:hypothetical protein